MEKIYRSLLFYFLLSLLIVSVYPLNNENIIGGSLAKEAQFPYQVFIEAFGSIVCGAAIIDKSHVITAAHCVMDKMKGTFHKYPYKIIGGTLDINIIDSFSQEALVEKMYVPVEYINFKYQRISDIAVLKLANPLDLKGNPYLHKVHLPDVKSDLLYNSHPAVVTGYGFNWLKLEKNNATGKMVETDGGTNGKLRYAMADVLSMKDCQKIYVWINADKHICARVQQRNLEKPEGVCSGDSGGPLVYNNVLIGVASSSPVGCSEKTGTGIYTRVASFLPFIYKALKDRKDSSILKMTLPTQYYTD